MPPELKGQCHEHDLPTGSLYFLRRSRHDADLREEIETHRALRQAALERDGLAPEDAARESRRAMGNVTLAVEDARDVRDPCARAHGRLRRQDVRDRVRGLRKSPGFTFVAIVTLALGIGANTALFSIFNGLILRPLPVRDPASLALLTDGSWSYPIWQQIRAHDNRPVRRRPRLVGPELRSVAGRPDRARRGRTSADVSSTMLGVPAARGRMLTPADDSGAAPDGPVAVISHRFWRQHFGGADDVVGRQLTDPARPVHHRRRDAARLLRRRRRPGRGRDTAVRRRAAPARPRKPAAERRLVHG